MKSLFPRIRYESHQPKLSGSLGIEKKVGDVLWCLSVLSDLAKRKSRD